MFSEGIGNNTGRGVRILSAKVSDTTGGSRPARADWSTVEAPTLVSAKQITDKNDIEVKVTGLVGYDGADTLVITMKDEAGTVVKTQSVAKDGKDFTVTFTPENSGKYVFSVVATRDGEENKAAENTLDVDFALVLATPVISSATSKGNNSVEVIWGAVKEATGYIVTAATEGEKDVSVTKKADETTALLTGLIVGKAYTISVVAVRGEDKTKPGTATVTVTAEAQRVWSKSTYGCQ